MAESNLRSSCTVEFGWNKKFGEKYNLNFVFRDTFLILVNRGMVPLVVKENKERNLTMFGINECAICGGRGYNRVNCDRCGGTGYREHLDEHGNWVREYCDECGGDGKIDVECSCRR